MSNPADSSSPPLRRDAQRNVERIRAAARRVFRERGLEASHEAIAREAEVSIGTVYRRFPDREQLIDMLFEQELDAVVAITEEALQVDDPWAGLVQLCERTTELSSENLGLKQLINGSQHGGERIRRVRDRLAPLGTAVMKRAQAAGAVRSDAVPQDLPMTMVMLGTLVDAGRTHAPDAWRRYLALILDGLRPEGQRRAALPAPVTLDQMDRIIAASS